MQGRQLPHGPAACTCATSLWALDAEDVQQLCSSRRPDRNSPSEFAGQFGHGQGSAQVQGRSRAIAVDDEDCSCGLRALFGRTALLEGELC